MICEEELKNEFKLDSQQCPTCLSIGRKLALLGPNVDILRKLLPQCGYWNAFDMESVEICWECHSLLLKILKFQNKVVKAAEILQLRQAYLYGTLSNLTSVVFKDSDKNVVYVSQTDRQTYIETKAETIDSDTQDIDTGNISDDFTQNIKLLSVKSELKTEGVKKNKSKKVKNNKWAKKKALLNKKPKFKMILNYKDVFRRVKVSHEELEFCLKGERDSEFFKSRKHKCESCVLGFKDENALASHVKRCHSQTLGLFTCDLCATRLSDKRRLAQHIALHYYKYECALCNYSCYHKIHRLEHWKTHGKALQCVQCQLIFGTRREFFEHYKKWHEKFICNHCGVSFKMRYCIEDHIRKQHSSFECKQCDKRFSRYNGLWLHNKVCHTAPAPTQGAYCVECDRRYADVYRYRWHLSNSARHRPRPRLRIPCPGCDKVFTKKIYMKDHYDLVHLRNYKYTCEQCEKNFLRNADLVQHKRRIHEGILPPKNKICYMCGRGFSTNKILNNHMRTHTGERPFACARCPAAFAQSAALAGHTRAKHRAPQP